MGSPHGLAMQQRAIQLHNPAFETAGTNLVNWFIEFARVDAPKTKRPT